MDDKGLIAIQRERGRVDAEAQPGRRRAVREHMPEMRSALLAEHFHALRTVAGVGARHDIFRFIRLRKTRPPRAGIELGFRIEQCGTAAYAAIDSGIMAIPVRAAESRFGAALA